MRLLPGSRGGLGRRQLRVVAGLLTGKGLNSTRACAETSKALQSDRCGLAAAEPTVPLRASRYVPLAPRLVPRNIHRPGVRDFRAFPLVSALLALIGPRVSHPDTPTIPKEETSWSTGCAPAIPTRWALPLGAPSSGPALTKPASEHPLQTNAPGESRGRSILVR